MQAPILRQAEGASGSRAGPVRHQVEISLPVRFACLNLGSSRLPSSIVPPSITSSLLIVDGTFRCNMTVIKVPGTMLLVRIGTSGSAIVALPEPTNVRSVIWLIVIDQAEAKELYSDNPLHTLVHCSIDNAHASFPDLFQNPISTEHPRTPVRSPLYCLAGRDLIRETAF